MHRACVVRLKRSQQPSVSDQSAWLAGLKVRLRLPVAKTDVVAEPDVLAGVDAALAPVAREGARRCGRSTAAARWHPAPRRVSAARNYRSRSPPRHYDWALMEPWASDEDI